MQDRGRRKKIGFSVANSPLVKTAIAGEDPNWGRVIMAIGKAGVELNLNKLSLKFGDHRILVSGKIYDKYDENIVKDYMTGNSVEIIVDISTGRKNFTTYTMDLTHKYIEINADYRS